MKNVNMINRDVLLIIEFSRGDLVFSALTTAKFSGLKFKLVVNYWPVGIINFYKLRWYYNIPIFRQLFATQEGARHPLNKFLIEIFQVDEI